MENKKKSIYKSIMLVILTAFITFLITSFSIYSKIDNSEIKNIEPKNLSEILKDNTNTSELDKYLSRMKSTLEKYYLWPEKIDEQKLQSGAIEGYVRGLNDEYTEYIPADEMEKLREELSGSFTGIGIYMIADEESGKVLIYYPIPGSPADEAGLQPGDLIISVNGVEYTAEDFDKIAKYIKGDEGTTVSLEIERNKERLKFEIARKKIITNPITTEIIENDVGYINLPSFDEETSKNFKDKVNELIGQGIKSLIIDVRNNGGGIVDEATKIADDVLNKGDKIISTVDNKNNKIPTYSDNEPIFKIPMVILVNKNTASASEILACALQENNRAKVIGEKTYGKGVIQTVFSLLDGSGLKITTQEYYTPKENKINNVGITPDEEVKLPENVTNIYSVKKEDDTQLKRAVEILKKEGE